VREREHLEKTNQKERRDHFFCQLARGHFDACANDSTGWVSVLEATATSASYTEREINDFLERLVEDEWIELQDQAPLSGMRARLTAAGRARAQVICKDASFTPYS